MVLPDGFAIPSMPYLLFLALGTIVIGAVLWWLDPPLTDRTVLALMPWMGIGGALHVTHVIGIAPDPVDPLLGTPAVYIATAILAGVVWVIGTGALTASDRFLGGVGIVGLGLLAGAILVDGYLADSLLLLWPLVGVIAAIVSTGIIWYALSRFAPNIAAVTAGSGLAVIFAHMLDAISTAIGVDLLDAGERSPLPRAIMDVATYVPGSEVIGVGWLFVLVKLVVAIAIVWLFVPFVRETERQGHLLLALLAAVGLGPGVHNLLLFMAGAG